MCNYLINNWRSWVTSTGKIKRETDTVCGILPSDQAELLSLEAHFHLSCAYWAKFALLGDPHLWTAATSPGATRSERQHTFCLTTHPLTSDYFQNHSRQLSKVEKKKEGRGGTGKVFIHWGKKVHTNSSDSSGFLERDMLNYVKSNRWIASFLSSSWALMKNKLNKNVLSVISRACVNLPVWGGGVWSELHAAPHAEKSKQPQRSSLKPALQTGSRKSGHHSSASPKHTKHTSTIEWSREGESRQRTGREEVKTVKK